MKKNKFTEFFKGKGYYVLLFVGVIAIAAVAVIGSQITSNSNNENNLVDINETDNNLAAGEEDTELAENNPVSEGIVDNGTSEDIAANDDTTNNAVAEGDDAQDVAGNGPELEGYDEDNVSNSDGEDMLADTGEADEVAQVEDTVEASTSTAQNETNDTVESLSFSVDEGLMWPVQGNVIMDYSVDHTVYFATLMEYKINPAIIVDAEVGDEVKAAATGVVTKVEEKADNEETGLTVTMNIGDGYSLVYGQLSDVNLKVGDLVQEGDVIATVAEPTKYYSVEGSNLYFQVLQDDQTVNPMLLLR